MIAVSKIHLETIKNLQNLPSLSKFSLAGGTNLALRFNHRESIDIDLFTSEIVGQQGLKGIEKEVKQLFGNKAQSFVRPCDIDDQYSFLRFFVIQSNCAIKVEIIQNMKKLDKIEEIDGIRLYTIKDVGVFKLISASSRFAKKDIYDLDFITDSIDIVHLFDSLREKENICKKEENKNIFHLNDDPGPISNPALLLKFDENQQDSSKPFHSNDRMNIIKGQRSWSSAKFNYRMKIRDLFKHLQIDFPGL